MPREYDRAYGGYREVFFASDGRKFYSRLERDRYSRGLADKRRYDEATAAEQEKAARKKARAARRAANPTLPRPMASAIALLPRSLQPVVRKIARDTAMNQPMLMLMERASEFSTPAAAVLAGVALDPNARKTFDAHLDSTWAATKLPSPAKEVIIGGGLHAAIYSAIRVAMGHPAPLVLERRERVGGAFAVSASPTFYLNSRNRPGPLSVPGETMGALNVLPGAMVQPSDLGGAEYQTNDALGMVIRSTLAMNATVASGVEVMEIRVSGPDAEGYDIVFKDGRKMYAKRVILATGLNEPQDRTGLASERKLDFEQFMRKLDEPFPLRGVTRVAVLGGGDGGKTVIEALTGQGPQRPLTIATLDYPQTIDWYGAPNQTCESFAENQRPRYRGIARLLPSGLNPSRPFRVRPRGLATAYQEGYDRVYVADVPYDLIVDATGYRTGSTVFVATAQEYEEISSKDEIVGGRNVATRYTYERSREVPKPLDILVIGPAAMVPVSEGEEMLLRGIAENTTSLFRYASRTAALAASLP